MKPFFKRRQVIWGLFGLLGLAGRPAFGSVASHATGYLDLKDKVDLPISDLTAVWAQQAFEAWVPMQGADDKLLKGLVLRVSHSRQDDTGLRAFCIYCPHEICEVALVQDTGKVRLDSGVLPEHPLIVCPCHFSAFDPLQDGVNISGPSFRGLFRFRVMTRGDRIHITHVERNALTLFN